MGWKEIRKVDNGVFANVLLCHEQKANSMMDKEKTERNTEAVKEPAQEQQMADEQNQGDDVNESPQQQEDVANKDAVNVDMVARDEVNRLVAEAEARGYMRGRNETAAESVHTPRLWENTRRTAMEQECEPNPAAGFLSKIRPGVWD